MSVLFVDGRTAASARRQEIPLKQLFATFPSGLPGFGLLLLRTAVAMMTAIEGAGFLISRGDHAFAWALGGTLVIILSASLAFGFFTPIAAVILAAGTASISLWQLPSSAPRVFDSTPATILIVVISAALVLIGPGSFSLDSYFFGHREIVIPSAHARH